MRQQVVDRLMPFLLIIVLFVHTVQLLPWELAMHRAERILIKPSDTNYRAVARICREAKTVFNCANYLMRQSFFNGKLIALGDYRQALETRFFGASVLLSASRRHEPGDHSAPWQ